MLDNKTLNIIKIIKDDKVDLENQLVQEGIINKDFNREITYIKWKIDEYLNKLVNNDYTIESIDNMLINLLKFKNRLTNYNFDLKFIKVQIENTENNTKLNLIEESFNEDNWKIDKTLIKEKLSNKMLGLRSYQAYMEDLQYEIKKIEDVIQNAIIIVQSKMKYENSQFLMAHKV